MPARITSLWARWKPSARWVFSSSVAFRPDRLLRAEMLDFGYRRLKGRTAPIALSMLSEN